jgi:hypothetical protein
MISDNLKNKILDYGEYSSETSMINVPSIGGNSNSFPGRITINFEISHEHLTINDISEITKWISKINNVSTGYGPDYEGYKEDIGMFEGVFPTFHSQDKTEFNVDNMRRYPDIENVITYKEYKKYIPSLERRKILNDLLNSGLEFEEQSFCEEQILLEI